MLGYKSVKCIRSFPGILEEGKIYKVKQHPSIDGRYEVYGIETNRPLGLMKNRFVDYVIKNLPKDDV